MSSPRSNLASPHPVLPPIVSTERDRDFLVTLNGQIDHELTQVDRQNPEQRYIVYKAAFDRIIDYVTAYKPVLTAIKAEYEDCIETIQRGQREAFYLTGKLKAMAHEPSTIHNYRKRADELDQKLTIIEDDNEKLQRQLDVLREAREKKERRAKELEEEPKTEAKKDSRTIPGLTLQQSTDVKTLTRELEKLERQLRELSISQRTRYSSRDFQNHLKRQLEEKVCLRDELTENIEVYKAKSQKLKIAVESAQAYLKIQPPHQTIGDAVVLALARGSNQLNLDKAAEEGLAYGTPSTTFEDSDDPSKEKEAEMMLEYIEKFNELLEDRLYDEAAMHAANSPKGILRTPETLLRFKDMKGMTTATGRSPLLAFCDSMMSTVPAYETRPSVFMSLECVKCSLEENRLDLLSHWISQDRLTLTKELGDMIYTFHHSHANRSNKCLALAQQVFTEIEHHTLAVICMVKQGHLKQALEYAQQRARLKEKDYAEVLREVPSLQLAASLFSKNLRGNHLLPLGMILSTLIRASAFGIGLKLLENLHITPQDAADDSSSIRHAVFEDTKTSADVWLEIIQECQIHNSKDIGIELLAAVTVVDAVRAASKVAHQMETTDQLPDEHVDEDQSDHLQSQSDERADVLEHSDLLEEEEEEEEATDN